MGNFQYTARNNEGKIVNGTVVADDRAAASNIILQQKLQPLVVKEQGKKGDIHVPKFLKHTRVKPKERVIFTRQLASMVNAGVPLVRSLVTLQSQTESPAFKGIIGRVTKKVESGTSLADALGEHPRVFSSVYTNMVRAGEAGGILDDILQRLAVQQEKDSAMRGKLKSAMTYPMVIIVITVGAFFFLMTTIVPKIASILEGLNSNIPLPIYTRILLGISGFLTQYMFFVIIGGVGGIIFLTRFIRTPRGRMLFDRLLLKLPIIKKIILKVAIARFARTFSSLNASGVGVLDSLRVTGEAIGNTVVKAHLDKAAQAVKNGKPLSAPLLESEIFPPIVSQMLAIGEETGDMDTILTKLADFYEEEVDEVVSSLTSIIEPVMIVVLGSMIGLIAVSVFGPISQITQGI